MSAFDDFLAENAAQRCWLLELDPLSLAPLSDGSSFSGAFSDAAFSEAAFSEGDSVDSVSLYYSSHGFTSRPADAPANTYYHSRIGAQVKVERQIFGKDGVGGLARTFADATLLNADGELDALQEQYALDGRPVRLYLGRPGDARSAFGLVFAGVIQVIEKGELKVLVLKLSDGIARLDVPVSHNTYKGTGGLEGGADLAGKPKPRGWGNSLNIAPPLVNSALLIYQANDGEISDVPAVYDRGIALVKGADYASQADMEANAPAAGNFRVWKAGGFFRLGSTPAGTVTNDLLGDAAGGYVNKTADIAQRVLLIGSIDFSLLDAASFATLNVDAPAEVGCWVGTEVVLVRDLVERLLVGVGAFGGFSRTGLFNVGVVKAPAGAPVDTFTEEDISAITREPLPPDLEPAVWRARVAWQRNYTVQTDFAAAVPAARRTFAAEPQRIAEKDDPGVKSQRLLAREYGPTGDLYAQQADAATEALRRLNLWKAPRGLYRLLLPARALARDLGHEVAVKHSRYGFAAGKNAMVLGHAVRGTRVELTVLA